MAPEETNVNQLRYRMSEEEIRLLRVVEARVARATQDLRTFVNLCASGHNLDPNGLDFDCVTGTYYDRRRDPS